jgi:L-2-hydroxyglutarate oxidase LhgO
MLSVNISHPKIGALYFPHEGTVNPRRMTKTMGIMAKGAGAIVKLQTEVIEFKSSEAGYIIDIKKNGQMKEIEAYS